MIGAGSYRVFTETDFNAVPGGLNSFSLSSSGDEVYLLSGQGTNITGYSHGFAFGAAENGVAFGRYFNSQGEELFPAQISNTLGDSNSGPRVGPIVISEIQYHPDVGFDEFVELQNITSAAVRLYDTSYPTNTWKLGGLGYTFQTNITIPANGLALISPLAPATFRAKYSVPDEVQVLGPYTGVLQDSGERLELKRPDAPDTNGVPYIVVDEVRYNDKLPWPVVADGTGPSLQRLVATAYGNDPTNWFASGMTPGRNNSFNTSPSVLITTPSADETFGPTDPIAMAATANDPDGTVRSVEFFANGLKVGERTNAPYHITWTNTQPGTFSLTARAVDDGFAIGVSAPVPITVLAPVLTNLIEKRSVWKYLDNGTDQGTAWRAINFDDSAWASGPAQLGYGDGDEATTNSFGPDANNKYITTYYRRAFVITNASKFLGLTVSVLRDDGAVVYLNGTEVFRSNMPLGPVNYLTPASSAVSGGDETSTFYNGDVSASILTNGTNVVAVEIHQSSGASSDISFDLELRGSINPPRPRIEITSPTNNATLLESSNVTVTATPTDIDGTITNVEFFVDAANIGRSTMTPYSVTWSNVPRGAHQLKAVAFISGGLTKTSAPVNVTVTARDSDGDGMPDYWETSFGFSTNNAADATQDADGDGMINRDEFRAGTNPRDASSVLRLSILVGNPVHVGFTAQSNIAYAIQGAATLPSSWTPITNITAAPQARSIDLLISPTGTQRFIRVIVP